ncbi:MAG: hypothetical protein A2252_12190 [Elusimicrobia bacterium RIFOXYA2_FULL_39_19]|nr:MAG: hypothetical protein A2252_12190 [Elusimicrobia bacterium RIFOXYA2_FULL_39_19]
MKPFDVIVIGAGASGTFAAICSAQKGKKVLLIEKNDCICKKLGITGNGRCNITHTGEIKEFINCYGKNGKFLYRAFNSFFNNDLLSFLSSRGVETKIEDNGKYYPVSNTADTIITVLRNSLKEHNVRIKYNSTVESITLSGNTKTIKLKTGSENYEADKIIIATGGLSYPATGSTGDGYLFAKSLGINVTELYPALVPLETREKNVKELQGFALENVIISLYAAGKKIATETGDMLFTHYGLSGPAIMNLSGYAADYLNKNEKVEVAINLAPAYTQESLKAELNKEILKAGKKIFANGIRKFIPSKLVPVMTAVTGISENKQCNQLTAKEREIIVDFISAFRLEITKTRPIEEATITRGGIALEEINPQTMESKKIKGLHFCGEIINIDGKCGGYNLQEAFSTAYLAAENC